MTPKRILTPEEWAEELGIVEEGNIVSENDLENSDAAERGDSL